MLIVEKAIRSSFSWWPVKDPNALMIHLFQAFVPTSHHLASASKISACSDDGACTDDDGAVKSCCQIVVKKFTVAYRNT